MARKVELEFVEKLTYTRTVVVEIPDGMSEDDLTDILDDADQSEETLDDYMRFLRDEGIECPDGWDDDLSSPQSMEVECQYYLFVKESEAKA